MCSASTRCRASSWRTSRRRSAAPMCSPTTSWRSTPAGISRCFRSKLASWAKRGFDLGLTGFDEFELGELFAERTQGRTDPDDAPEPPAHPVAEPGDLWALGCHRLLCGNSTVATDVARVLGGVAPHLMVTDPPYGVNYDPAWRNQAGRSINGTTRRIAAGPVIKPSGARAVGKGVHDDRADWREAWALFPGSVAYIWHAGTKAGIVQDSLARLRLRHPLANHLGEKQLRDRPRPLPLQARAVLVRGAQG